MPTRTLMILSPLTAAPIDGRDHAAGLYAGIAFGLVAVVLTLAAIYFSPPRHRTDRDASGAAIPSARVVFPLLCEAGAFITVAIGYTSLSDAPAGQQVTGMALLSIPLCLSILTMFYVLTLMCYEHNATRPATRQ